MQSVKGIARSTSSVIYEEIRSGVSRRLIHPLKASHVIATAIQNGHDPPEITPSSRENLRFVIHNYMQRSMHKYALDEVYRCLARGHIDDFTLLHPIANDYIDCLIKQQDPSYRPGASASVRAAARARNLIVAARFVARMDFYGRATSITAETYNRLIEKMEACPDNCNPNGIVSIALKNKIPLDTRSWNVRLRAATKKSPQKVMQAFQQMTNSGIQLDKYTFAIVLKSMRLDRTMLEKADRIVEIAKHMKMYNEVIAVEELMLLKKEGKYQELLQTFSEAFEPQLLSHLGFRHIGKRPSETPTRALLPVTKISLSVVLDALVHLNNTPENLEQMYEGYKRFIEGREEFANDAYSPSIFMRAFANNPVTLERCLEILEEMRNSDNKPTIVSYTHVIDGLARYGMIDLATRVLQYMKIEGHEPNEYTWQILERGYERAGHAEAMQHAKNKIEDIRKWWLKSGRKQWQLPEQSSTGPRRSRPRPSVLSKDKAVELNA